MEMDFDIDKEMELRLKWNWCAKWKMVRLLKKTIDIAESSLDDDARFLKSAIEEKNRQQEYMESATEEEKKARHETMYNKQCELEKIFNLTGFVDINSIDICLLSQKMIKERKKWSRNLYARYAYMLMYELTEDITQLLGNDKDKKTGHVYGIRTLVKSMGDQELENELNNNSKLWNGFWDKIGANGRDFSSIRNTSTAHRDHDFLKQYEAMTKISWGSALADISEFSIMYTILRGFLRDFMVRYFEKYNRDVEPLIGRK